MRENQILTIRVRILDSRPKAVRIDHGPDCWLPLSQIEIGEERKDGTTPIELPEWLILDRDLDALVEET